MLRAQRRNLGATLTIIPFWVIILGGYIGTIVWTVYISLTSSRMLPNTSFVGLDQYQRLFGLGRWSLAVHNLVVFGLLLMALCLIIGFLLAVMLDRQIRAEGVVRTIILYPHAISFIVTGLVWQWMLNPTVGIEKAVRDFGWSTFAFDWLIRPEMAIYALVLAGVWQGSGLIMALMLAGLRGIDQDIWKAARIDGIPTWRVYLSIVIPMMRPTIITCVVLMSLSIVKVYDLVVALTGGGPGLSTDVPAKFIMDFLFERSNIGLAAAAATTLLVFVLMIFVPWYYVEYCRDKKGAN
ncbi:sugar ABC transporter permease (plasmid) [Martelella sp. AD-3]|uniref:carbohydrate ABC transporter permease n=1 Tax=Martelella sp. AD-3 TaxID=686597 RepID=UPI000777487F|nr:sugar ABC transporter permease [Martelella sp. AD-3]AMM87314.1 sugar ABC transporter permease [Martelella sp. AD-3]